MTACDPPAAVAERLSRAAQNDAGAVVTYVGAIEAESALRYVAGPLAGTSALTRRTVRERDTGISTTEAPGEAAAVRESGPC